MALNGTSSRFRENCNGSGDELILVVVAFSISLHYWKCEKYIQLLGI